MTLKVRGAGIFSLCSFQKTYFLNALVLTLILRYPFICKAALLQCYQFNSIMAGKNIFINTFCKFPNIF